MAVEHRYAADDPRHPIQVVARRTGLTPDVIRAWERRHGAVAPQRSRTKRRLYSESDVERLLLLRRATLLGRRIGDVAHLPSRDLRRLVDSDETATARAPVASVQIADSPATQAHLQTSLEALKALDAALLDSALSSAALALRTPVLIERVLAPLMRRVGEGWRDGSLRIAHERLASTSVRSLLHSMRAAHSIPGAGPDIVLGTPAGQHHDLGALMAAVTAASVGWRATFLGPDIPAEEMAVAAGMRRARAVALSLVYPSGDSRLGTELRNLRRSLPSEIALLVGGSVASSYDPVLRETGVLRLQDLSAFGAQLETLRA